jgi:hypothetical protein
VTVFIVAFLCCGKERIGAMMAGSDIELFDEAYMMDQTFVILFGYRIKHLGE